MELGGPGLEPDAWKTIGLGSHRDRDGYHAAGVANVSRRADCEVSHALASPTAASMGELSVDYLRVYR